MPAQDKQYLVGFAQLPDGATLDRTEDVIRRMGEIALKHAGRRKTRSPSRACRSTASPTARTPASSSSTLKPFDERKAPSSQRRRDRRRSSTGKFAGIQEAFIAIFPPPPVQGLGTTGGFKLQIEDRAGARLRGARRRRPRRSWPRPTQAPELAGLFSSYQVNVPQLYADIDRTKARQLGVPVTDVFDTMQIYLGSLYVNDFNKFGRTYSVRVQADAQYRARADDVGLLKVRSDTGEMVPLSALLKVKASAGPERAMRYNGFLAADINGGAGARLFVRARRRTRSRRIAAETLPEGHRASSGPS